MNIKIYVQMGIKIVKMDIKIVKMDKKIVQNGHKNN